MTSILFYESSYVLFISLFLWLSLFLPVLVLVRRGCNPNEESPRGITPLICMGRYCSCG